MYYRYITCGLVSPDEPVSHFRLIAGRNLNRADIVIRITIPDKTCLHKCACDSYSTCEDQNLLIKDCKPILMVRVNHRLRPMPGIWPTHQPHQVHEELIRKGWRYDLKTKSYYQTMLRPQVVLNLLNNA